MRRAPNAHGNPTHANSAFCNPIGAHGHADTYPDIQANLDISPLNLGQLRERPNNQPGFGQ
jgi:hypothetical protein